jgi:hypothetical protein
MSIFVTFWDFYGITLEEFVSLPEDELGWRAGVAPLTIWPSLF